MRFILNSAGVVFFCLLLSACSPEVGSEGWCKDMKEKSKGDWTANEMKNFTKHCLFK